MPKTDVSKRVYSSDPGGAAISARPETLPKMSSPNLDMITQGNDGIEDVKDRHFFERLIDVGINEFLELSAMREQINPILLPYALETGVFPLLDACVGRILRREGGDVIIDKEKLRHIADWLRAALANDELWLKNVDEHGRSKKLMKFSTIDAIVQEADKAMLKAAQRLMSVKLIDGDEELVEMLKDGYHIIRLITPAALDRESSEMQHCVGNGGYDDRLRDGIHEYLSLRDTAGKAHATIESRKGRVVQIQGKQNQPPISKYIDLLGPYFRASGLTVDVPASHLGYVIDVDGMWHPVDNLPEGLNVGANLDLRAANITTLPDGLRVEGNLILIGNPIAKLPECLSVSGDLYLHGAPITELPKGLSVGKALYLIDTNIVALPEDLEIGGGLYLSHTPITKIPDGLSVSGDLVLNKTSITALPKGLSVSETFNLSNTPIVALPDDIKVGGNLTLNDTQIAALPKGLSVNGDLDLRRTPITTLPEGLTVKGDLYLHETLMVTLPEGLTVGGRVYPDWTSITALPDSICNYTSLQCGDRTLIANVFRRMTTEKRPSIFRRAMDLIVSKLTAIPQVMISTWTKRHAR